MQRMQILLGEINLKKQEPMHFAKLILLVLALAGKLALCVQCVLFSIA